MSLTLRRVEALMVKTVIFYCQRLMTEKERKGLEKAYGNGLSLYPMPCSGRIEGIHILKALETGGDFVGVITCPLGECNYKEGNLRILKRLERVKERLSQIGLEPDRVGIWRQEKEEEGLPIEKIIEQAATLGELPWHREKGA